MSQRVQKLQVKEFKKDPEKKKNLKNSQSLSIIYKQK